MKKETSWTREVITIPLTNAYRDYVTTKTTGGAGAAFDNANAHIGVGDSSSGFAAGQTDLAASSNKVRKAMDSGYPQVAANVITARATFGTGDANFAWNEWGFFNAATGGTMMSRKVESLGTKTAAQSWQVTVTLTINV